MRLGTVLFVDQRLALIATTFADAESLPIFVKTESYLQSNLGLISLGELNRQDQLLLLQSGA